MATEIFFLPDGTVTHNAADAAEQWSKAFFAARDALERIRPVPERLLKRVPVRCLEEILAECDSVLNRYWNGIK